MKNIKFRIVGFAALVLAAGALLTGCTFNFGNQEPPKQGQSQQDREDQNQMRMDATLMFSQMMIPHHQQAIEMGDLAETRASSPKVKSLAKKIRDEQAPEIELMQSWLKAAGVKLGESMGHMNHGDHGMTNMDGMLTTDQMAALKSASGDIFDRLYLRYMIAHHEGAIQMATEFETSGDAKLEKLTMAIIKSQTEQISYMKELQAK